MTYKVCYWDNDAKEQKERDATPEEIAEIEDRKLLAGIPTVPQEVTMRQARLALIAAGLYTTVNNAVTSMTGSAGDSARVEWEYSQVVQRNRGLVTALAAQLGLTNAEIDDLFILAETL